MALFSRDRSSLQKIAFTVSAFWCLFSVVLLYYGVKQFIIATSAGPLASLVYGDAFGLLLHGVIILTPGLMYLRAKLATHLIALGAMLTLLTLTCGFFSAFIELDRSFLMPHRMLQVLVPVLLLGLVSAIICIRTGVILFAQEKEIEKETDKGFKYREI